MIQAIKSQVAFAMKQKAAILTFYLLLTLVLLNFTTNVFAFQGSDVIEIYLCSLYQKLLRGYE